MAKVLQNIFIPSVDEIAQNFTVESWHVSQSVDAFTGASDYDITISGSLDVTGPLDVTGDLDVTGNSLVTGYSTVNDFIIYNTSSNIAIVSTNLFNSTTDIGTFNNIRLGGSAGQSTQNTMGSIMVGFGAGSSATDASDSNFIGTVAGTFATFASSSNFIGYAAGQFSSRASYSNLFGYNVGRGDISGNSIGPNNIIIGTNISLPYNYRNGINLGGILFGSGSYYDPSSSGSIFSGSVGNGRIGINQPNPSFNLDVSGSGRFTNGVTVTGSFISSGSLSILSTGSIALNGPITLTGSLNTSGSVTLRGLDTTPKSFVVTIDNTTGQLFYTSSTGFLGTAGSPGPPTGSIQYNNAGTFGGVPTLTYDGTTLRATGSFTGSFVGAFVGNLTGTSSQATNAFTSSNLNITYNDNTNANFQLLWGSGTRAYGNGNVFVNPSTAKLFTQRFEVNGAGNATTGNGQIYLNGSTGGNRIEFKQSVGIGAPSTGTAGGTGRSEGTKIVLWPGVGDSPSSVDYAMGIESAALWHSVAGSTDTFKWYAGTTNIAKLTGTGALIVGNISPSATAGYIYASGDVVAFATSDKRLKDNITPISNPIEKIQKIGGYEFDWIPTEEAHSYEGHDIGVIAQEIEEVLPELVTTRDNGYKAVKYEKIVALLIEAIKDQQKQIDDLKSKIE
jgi:hypothetical protein